MDIAQQGSVGDEGVAIGPHRFSEYAQHCEWQPHGAIELPHAEEFAKRLLAHQARVGQIALIVDGRELSPLSPAVRSFYVQALGQLSNRLLVVVFGTSLLAKVTQTLAVRAGQIIHNIKIDLRYVETREAAVAYIQNR